MDETPRQVRSEIEELTDDSGRFYIACVETGERPAPVTGARFDTHEDAERALALARRYRETIREHDPGLPRYRLVVSELSEGPLQLAGIRERTGGTRSNGLPRTRRSVTLSSDGEGQWLRMENAPLVHLARNNRPVGDDAVARQLDSKL